MAKESDELRDARAAMIMVQERLRRARQEALDAELEVMHLGWWVYDLERAD